MKTKATYRVYKTGPGSLSPLYSSTSVWEALRFIAYVLREGNRGSVTIEKE